MIRVGNIIEEARLGGPQVRIQRVACFLTSKVETTVILPKEQSERFCGLLDDCNIPYKTLFLTRITKQLSHALRYLLFSWAEILYLIYYFKKQKFDVIHVSGGSWQYKGVIAGKLSGNKVIWHLNDTSMSFLFKLIFKSLSALPDHYIFASERTKNYYLSWNKNSEASHSIIRQPVDVNRYSPKAIASGYNALKEKYKGKLVVGTVANINPTKAIDVFIKVAAKIENSINDVIFIVVGPVHKSQQGYNKQLNKLIDSLQVTNVIFVGYSDNIQAYMKLFDIFLCTSISEAGPMTLWEAMSSGTAVVSTDVGDVKQFVKNDISGYIVDVGDYKTMSEYVQHLLIDREKRELLSINGRNTIINNLSSKICADQHYQVYKKLLKL